ncbi:MAG TPA: MBL fold metallo-hydrolase [Vicinamibacterales bacterium]|nr:MBL fold metallo-hydrolase [Vicinamibacterales bacterium]
MTHLPNTSVSLTRRRLLKSGLTIAGGALIAPALPSWVARPSAAVLPQAADPLAPMRAQFAAVPISISKLTDTLAMLSGPGGNMVVMTGPDGKIVVDTFVQSVWDKLKAALDQLGPAKITSLIDTHWHFDHTDNNANFRKAGAVVLAHENTKKRMGQSHELLGMKLAPSPEEAWPTQTFAGRHTLNANGETVQLAHVPPAHTDTDITIRFQKANVLHMGDLYFEGMYPFIDAGTGGTINGMIAAATATLKTVDGKTTIVPGHGPAGNQASLTKFRDMMATVRERVEKLKKEGRTVEEAVAAAPTKDLDETWGKGFLQPNQFVTIVYNTL